MIKREEVEALLAASQPGVVTDRDSDAFLRACDRLTRRMLAELARTWLRVNDAPVVPVSEQVTFPNVPPMDWNDSCFRTSYVRMLRCDESGRLVPEADSGGDRG